MGERPRPPWPFGRPVLPLGGYSKTRGRDAVSSLDSPAWDPPNNDGTAVPEENEFVLGPLEEE